MAIIQPDVILYNTIKGILTKIQDDYNSAATEPESILYKLTNGVKLGDYDFFEQAKEVFFKDKDARRAVDLRVGWDTSRAGLPTIYINMPSEGVGPDNGLGVDEGIDTVYDQSSGTYRNLYQRSFQSTYSIVITSNIRNEVVLIYNVLKAFMIPLMDHLEMEGLQNPKLSGRDLGMGDNKIVPKEIMMRTLNIEFYYDQSVEDLFDTDYITSLLFDGTGYISGDFSSLDNS